MFICLNVFVVLVVYFCIVYEYVNFYGGVGLCDFIIMLSMYMLLVGVLLV